MKKYLALIAVPFLLSACGNKLNGRYENSDHTMNLTFESGEKVIINGGGVMNTEFSYQLDGKLLKIQLPDGVRVLTLEDNGDIQVPPNIILKKQ
ncbi:TPA: hypothetical protein QDB08_003935 [Burkholderia vietnamiensis]|uniref:hypothetical protein n=1 Tax=Burkholderia vietnamiensis TaxID=60552 RepID=UPI001593F24B|nr:hypothetical protein [Burkholderia vietnamiensis]HDR9010942.1 hypothetical protein [Burkholderia vietnamiensis]HDR9017154.1 hypothetical protein [Burkholderia vietnamiensis]